MSCTELTQRIFPAEDDTPLRTPCRLKTRTASRLYGFDFRYESRPAWPTYASLLDFAATIRRDVRDLRPRDLIDVQSFIWVQGSDEYEE